MSGWKLLDPTTYVSSVCVQKKNVHPKKEINPTAFPPQAKSYTCFAPNMNIIAKMNV
jgi:hypothetical protein